MNAAPPATSAEAETSGGIGTDEKPIHILWISAGLSHDGDSVALTAAMRPGIEEITLGGPPGPPKIAVHWPLIDFGCGPVGGADTFIEWFSKGERGEIGPFVLVIEGSAPVIPLDDKLRPTWLFGATVHEGCDRAGYYEQGRFAASYDSPRCLVKKGTQMAAHRPGTHHRLPAALVTTT